MKVSQLFRSISYFTFFNFLNKGLPFLILPILTKYLSPEEYGIIDLYTNIAIILTPLIAWSSPQSLSRYYFDNKRIDFLITTIFRMIIKGAILFAIVVFTLNLLIESFLPNRIFTGKLISLAVFYAISNQVSELLFNYLRVSNKVISFGLLNTCKIILEIGLALLLIMNFGLGWEGKVYPQVLVSFVFSVCVVKYLTSSGLLNLYQQKDEYRDEILDFSKPLIIHNLSAHLIGFADRFFIVGILSLSDLGIYSVGYQIGMVISLLQNSFNQAWVPYFFKSLSENQEKSRVKLIKSLYFYIVGLGVVTIVIYFSLPLVFSFIGEAYEGSLAVVGWILLGYFFNGIYKMLVNYLFYYKNTRVIAKFTFFSVVVNVLLNSILISMYGIIGAAIATTCTFIFLMAIVLIFVIKNYDLPWNLKN